VKIHRKAIFSPLNGCGEGGRMNSGKICHPKNKDAKDHIMMTVPNWTLCID
jgi:hypothetical protein